MEYNAESEGRENWELSKENIQPLSSGRRLEYISQALNSVDSHEDHEAKISEFEEEIKNYDGIDALEPWVKYISFLEQANLSFPTRKFEVITRCVKKFITQTQYANDKRFVEIFIQSTSTIPSPAKRATMLERALFMGDIGLGSKLSRMYLAIAENYEVIQQYPKAVEIIKAGIDKTALPIEYLQDGLIQLQYRVAEKLKREMTENSDTADLRNFGDSVPVFGADAPSIRMNLPPADPTQSKPGVKKDLRQLDVFKDIDSVSEDEKPTGSLTVESLPVTKKADKENRLEPSKWNKPENTLANRDEFCPPSRSQNPIQLYIDEKETQNVVDARKKPQQGVLSDRLEKTEFKKPNDVKDLANASVKICYRKNQLCQNGKELTFEHLRAAEYRKRLASKTAVKSSANSQLLENEKAQLLKEKEKENEILKQEIIELKQYRDKADFDSVKLRQKLAGLENLEIHVKELESGNKSLKMHLNDLEESYHNLNNEKDSLLKQLEERSNAFAELRAMYENERAFHLSQKKTMQVNMANWKTDISEQIRIEEENRLKKDFEDAHTIMKANYEENVAKITQEFSNMLECEKQRYRDLEKKYNEIFMSKRMSHTNVEESVQNKNNSDIRAVQPEILHGEISQVNISTSMYSDSTTVPSLTVQADLMKSNSSNINSAFSVLGNTNTRDNVALATTAVANNENSGFSAVGPTPKIIPAVANRRPITTVDDFLEPKGKPLARRLPRRIDPVAKIAAFSLYESHCETLNQGASILQDGLPRKPKSPVDYRNLPENRPIFTDLNDENKIPDNAELRKPLKKVLQHAPLAPVGESREDDRIMAMAMCDEKTMDFNITNNLTRALATDRPLLNSTPEDKDRQKFPRRKSMGRNLIRDISIIENETSVYVSPADFSDEEDDCETASREHKNAPLNQLNFTEAPIIQNLSTIQETSKENRSAYTTSSSSGSNMTNTNLTRGFASMSNFTRSGSVTASASRYVNQSSTYNNY